MMVGLFLVGLLAGAMNAVAGGGSFVTFPVLVLVGLPPVVANASSTVALFPGGLGSIWAFRHDLRPRFAGVGLAGLVAASAAGGLAGAVLLLLTPQATFERIVPWILLGATLTFAFGRRLGEGLRRHDLALGPAGTVALQVVLGVYAGYFGGAVGILMMAAWTVVTRDDAATLNPHRALLVNAANALAVLCFIVTGQVAWAATAPTLAGAILGGYGGAVYARRLDPLTLRLIVVAVGAAVTAGFFARLL